MRRAPANLLIYAGADCRRVEPLAIHLLRLDLLGDWVQPLIGVPEGRILLGELHAFFDEGLAVNVPAVDLVGSDARFVGAVRQYRPIGAAHHDIELAVDEPG